MPGRMTSKRCKLQNGIAVTLRAVLQWALPALLITIGASAVSADEIRVFSGGAPQHVLQSLAPEFEKATGHKLDFTFALVTAIQQKLAVGEKADIVMLPAPLLSVVEKALPFETGSRTSIARVGIGVIGPSSAKHVGISTADAVRTALLDARAVAFPDPSTPSGGHLARMLDQLGIAEKVRPKIINKAAIHGGGDLVAKGEADLGFYLLSEVNRIPGITVMGLLPPALQSYVEYAAAIPAGSAHLSGAKSLIRFLTDPSRRSQWLASGFELAAEAK